MIAGQEKCVARLRKCTDEAELALVEERWNDAQLALVGVELAADELRRGMPNPDPQSIGFL